MFVWSKLTSEKWVEAWEERLMGPNSERAVISRIPNRKSVRVDVYCDTKPEADEILKHYGGTVRQLAPQNWAALGGEPPPVNVRGRLLICGIADSKKLSALRAANGHLTIINIPPEMAFGTGHHATTSTVLRLMVDFADARKEQPWSMLDLGAGSGLLAIAAEKLGASEIWGCDFDATAVDIARRNVELNQASSVTIDEADVLKWKPDRRWDCVAANIFADVLEAVLPKLAKAVKPDGVILLSGILKDQAPACLEAGEKVGFVFDPVVKKGKWVTAVGRLQPKAVVASKKRAKASLQPVGD